MSVYNRSAFILTLLLLLVSCTSSKETMKIELTGYNNSSSLALLDDSLFIAAGTEEDFVDQIIEYNITEKTEQLVYKTEDDYQRINDLTVNNDHMIWVEATSYGELARVILLDRDSNNTKVIYEAKSDSLDLVAPSLSGRYVSWIAMGNEDDPAVVTLYDIETDTYETISEINHHNFYNNFIKMNEDRIYWTDIIDDANLFLTYDINSEEIKKLPAKFGTPGYIDALGDYMYALEFTDHFDWTTNKLTLTNSTGSDYKAITDEWVYEFSLFKENVVYIENENGKAIKYNLKSSKSEIIETDLEMIEIIQASSDLKYLMMKYGNDEEHKIEIELVPIN